MLSMKIPNPRLLLVDDSKNDVLLMRVAFEKAGFTNELMTVEDGLEAISYMCGLGKYADRTHYPFPDLLLLDLNMPRMNGFETLEWIRNQPRMRRLPVCILTASSLHEDIERAYDLHASCYLVKPGTLDDLVNMAQCLRQWLSIIQFAPVFENSGGMAASAVKILNPVLSNQG